MQKCQQTNACLTLENDQLDTHLLYFTIRLCFEHYMLIIRRLNCSDAASGIVTLSKWPSGAQNIKKSLYIMGYGTPHLVLW
jgi:hypothetical protein